jgi:hypothetical protein
MAKDVVSLAFTAWVNATTSLHSERVRMPLKACGGLAG